MANKYQKFGLRADKNLADLDNKQVALANTLDGIKTDDTGFAPGDLLVVSGLRNTEVDQSDLIQVGNDNILTTYSPVNDPNNPLPTVPLIRLVDRIENYKTITGTPPFINGGDGGSAWFVPSNHVTSASSIDETSTGADVLDINGADVIGPVDFWDNGNWRLGLKVNDTFIDTYGGIQWEGYTNLTTFNIGSTGKYIIEYDPLGTGYEIVKSIYAESIDVDYNFVSDDGTTTIVSVDEANLKYVTTGQYVLGSDNTTHVVVSKIERDAGGAGVHHLTLDGTTSNISASGGTVAFKMQQSEVETLSEEIRLRQTYTGDMFRIRLTVWWQDRGDSDRLPFKNFEFYDIDSERYPFSYVYKSYTRGQTPVVGTFEHFNKNKAGPNAQRSTAVLSTSNTIAIQYDPPVNTTDKVKVTGRTFTYSGLGKLEGDISNISVGDWVVANNGATYVCYQVEQIIDGDGSYNRPDAIFVNYSGFATAMNLNTGGTVSVSIIDHLGVIGVYKGVSVDADQTTLSAMTNGPAVSEVKLDMLACSSSMTKFKRIVNLSSGEITTEPVHGEGEAGAEAYSGTEIVVVCASFGLVDSSSEVQCEGVFGKEVTASSTNSGGRTTLTLTDTNGLVTSPNMYAYYLTGSSSPVQIPAGLTIYDVNTGANTIELSGTVNGTIEPGATIVFVPNSAYVREGSSYAFEGCVLPLNTAPPFAGTPEGLATITNYPNIEFNDVAFTELKVNNTTATTNTNMAYSEYLTLEYNGTNYKMLIQ